VRVQRAVEALRACGYGVREMPTTGPHMAADLAREAVADGVDLVAGCGGDGTLNEIVAGLIGTKTPFLALPGGTANVLCMETGLGRDVERVAAMARSLVPRRIAVGCCNGRHFLLMCGTGLDAQIVQNLDPATKKKLGKLAYWLAGFRAILRWLPEFDVRVNGDAYRASMALITRVRNYGGDLEIARSVRLSDEDFEVLMFGGRAAVWYGLYLAGILTNTLRLLPGVTIARARSVEVGDSLHAPVFVQLDGEAAGRAPARVSIVPDALTILLPEAYGKWTR
jgi:diacylglycerol kinase family enzyme